MQTESRRALISALVLLALAAGIALLWARSAGGDELKFGPGGCPVPWNIEWCVAQAGEDARGACSFGVPLPTRAGCLAKMKVVAKAATQAATARAKASRTEATTTGPRALAVPALKRGMGPRLSGNHFAVWQAIGGGCPDWLAELGNPRGCRRRIDFSVTDVVIDIALCGPNSGTPGTSPEWVKLRYGKPALGGFLPPANELFNLQCEHASGGAVTPGYDGIPTHLEAYDCMARHCWPGPVIQPPPPPKLCPNGNVDHGETCLTCPQDVACPPPPVPPPATTAKEAAEWIERLKVKLCANVAPTDLVSRQACATADALLLVNPLREAAGTVFLRARSAARTMTPRGYCLEISGQVPRTVEVSGERGSFAMPAVGVVREGRCP